MPLKPRKLGSSRTSIMKSSRLVFTDKDRPYYRVWRTKALPNSLIVQTAGEGMLLVPDIEGGIRKATPFKGNFKLERLSQRESLNKTKRINGEFDLMRLISKPFVAYDTSPDVDDFRVKFG